MAIVVDVAIPLRCCKHKSENEEAENLTTCICYLRQSFKSLKKRGFDGAVFKDRFNCKNVSLKK